MAGRRPLTNLEERKLLRIVRKLKSRDRALLTTQWFTGFRIREVLSLTIGQVWREDQIVSTIGIAPKNLKGHYGRTRWVPVLPELERALRRHLSWLSLKFELEPGLPLFPSRKERADGDIRAIGRVQAHRIVKCAFAKAGVYDDGRLGTHTFRKTFAKQVFKNSGHNLLVVKAALHHSSVAVTEHYLETSEDEVMAAIAKCDFTRGPRKVSAPVKLTPALPAPDGTAAAA